ncbi:MAG: 4'-phosphopantetheinyl transferase superfamily protein [Saprospiraceae bacterium]|nr:4'-phosphopantetheinyl transferase superfamily protein [Saprospiraceae bacterium]
MSERVIRGACLKDQYGKPYLKDSDYHISISHSSEYTAVIAAPVSVGVDIQVIVPKINRIAPRFVRDDEFINIPEDEHTHYFHAIWGAKESMYKSYGKKELDFKTHMKVSAFTYVKEGCFFEGEIIKGHYYQKYLLFCKQIQNLILVYALEQ